MGRRAMIMAANARNKAGDKVLATLHAALSKNTKLMEAHDANFADVAHVFRDAPTREHTAFLTGQRDGLKIVLFALYGDDSPEDN